MIDVDAYRHRYTFGEFYRALLPLYGSIRILKKSRESGLIDPQFVERLMLAVTEVNGCALCSYAHTNMALDLGLSQEEIEGFLGGNDLFVKSEEARAILFAQGYAEERGLFVQERYDALIGEYGPERSAAILASVRVMMVGNIIGLPYSALISRFKGKRYSNSSVLYEIGMGLAPFVLIPVTLVHRLLAKLIGR